MMNHPARRHLRDDGSALVAAVAVAIIGMAVSAVVVAQAITATGDSGRDRIRTLEVHSAESGLDAAMSEFDVGAPCPGPDWSPVEFGEGSTTTTVDVTIQYFNGTTALTCSSGTLSGSPTRAIITSTATANDTVAGIQPVRSMQAEVELTPHESTSPQSAIYSAGNMHSGNGFRLRPGPGLTTADVWIDSGDYICRQDDVLGDVYLLNGSLTVSNSTCRIDGDMWVSGNYFQSPATPAGTWQITGKLTVMGHMVLSNPTRIKGGASVQGNLYDNQIQANKLMTTSNNKWKNSVMTPFCSTNLNGPCTDLPTYERSYMPRFDFAKALWQPVNDASSPVNGKNFAYKTKEDFAAAMIDTMGLNQQLASDYYGTIWKINEINANPCGIPGTWISSNPILLPAKDLNQPTIYDMRDCASSTGSSKQVTANSKIIKVYSDIVILANGFQGYNGFRFESGDSQMHRIWLVVPSGSGTDGKGPTTITVGSNTNVPYDPLGMKFSSAGLQVGSNLEIFLYTPEHLEFPNISTFAGQMYGGQVTIDSGATITYAQVGAPGLSFTTTSSSSDGFEVAVLNKIELRN